MCNDLAFFRTGHPYCMVSLVGLFPCIRAKGVMGMGLGNRSGGGWHSRSQSHGTFRRFRRPGGVALAAVAALTLAAGCSSSSSSSGSSGTTSSGSNTIPAGLSISSFGVDIASEMSKFKPLTEFATKGAASLQIGVILPDTTSSTRWVDFDQPYLNDALADAVPVPNVVQVLEHCPTRLEVATFVVVEAVLEDEGLDAR